MLTARIWIDHIIVDLRFGENGFCLDFINNHGHFAVFASLFHRMRCMPGLGGLLISSQSYAAGHVPTELVYDTEFETESPQGI